LDAPHQELIVSTNLKTVPGGRVTGPATWAAAHARVLQWNHRARDPRDVQHATLQQLLKHAASTELGRAHGYAKLATYEDFKAAVPIRTYADYEPMLDRMRQGARDVIWPGLIPYYGQSSGTSNTAAQHKFLPVSMEQIRWQQRAGFDVVARYLVLSGDRDFTGGFTLNLLPPSTIKREGPVGVASNPGIMLNHLPAPARLASLPKAPVRDIADYDHKLTVIAESYLDHDVRALSGTTCWFSILFDRAIAAARRAGRNVDTVGEIWPNLRALFGGGVQADPYRKLIDERVGHTTVLVDNYNATEGGIFAATARLGDDSMMMIPDRGVFFEFVPRADHGKPNARRYALWEVEVDQEYSVVVTTSSGLFAYALGDFVRFTSIFPHHIKFTGRASGVLSLTQELTTAGEIDRATRYAFEATSSVPVDYAAAAEHGVDGTAKGRYVLFVEFSKSPASTQAFAEAFDRELCAANRVYREHRAGDVAILAPKVVPLVEGGTRRFMEALGQSSLQQKFPRILDDGRRTLMGTFAAREH
jgi:hypothetical protein